MRTEILLGGPAFLERLTTDVLAARRRVWLQTLTFEADSAGRPLAEALRATPAADRRVLVDSFTRWFINDRFVLSPGSLMDAGQRAEVRATREMMTELTRAGVAVRFTNPAGRALQRLFARDHKKLVVIDDDVAYIGGINFSDHNFEWRDLMVRIECGDAVRHLAADFRATWGGGPRPPARTLPGVAFHNVDGSDNAERLEPLFELIRAARTSIHVVSPYITDPFCAELRRARERGVAVTLLGTAGNNRGFVDRYVRREAARSGIDLRHHQGSMNHMKALLVDGEKLVLGSSNFDWLSYSLLGEIVAVFDEPSLVRAFVRDVLEPDLRSARAPEPVGAVAGWLAARQVAALARVVPVLCPPRRGCAVPLAAEVRPIAPSRGFAGLRRRMSRVAAAAAVLSSTLLGACAPVLSHGPRVRDGTAAGVGGTVLYDFDGDPLQAVVPYLTVGNDRGAGNGGRQFTAQAVIPTAAFGPNSDNDGLVFGLQGDYYRQAPVSDRMVHGFGVHAGFFHVMPYGQWGRYQDGVGIYTTQGVGSFGPWLGLAPEIVFWSPGAGMEVDLDGLTVRASMSTMIGWRLDRMERIDGVPISVGVAIEAGPPFARRSPGDDE